MISFFSITFISLTTLYLSFLHQVKAATLVCDQSSECAETVIRLDESGYTDLECSGSGSCRNSRINCTASTCQITCSGWMSCQNDRIYVDYSNRAEILCSGDNACSYGHFYVESPAASMNVTCRRDDEACKTLRVTSYGGETAVNCQGRDDDVCTGMTITCHDTPNQDSCRLQCSDSYSPACVDTQLICEDGAKCSAIAVTEETVSGDSYLTCESGNVNDCFCDNFECIYPTTEPTESPVTGSPTTTTESDEEGQDSSINFDNSSELVQWIVIAIGVIIFILALWKFRKRRRKSREARVKSQIERETGTTAATGTAGTTGTTATTGTSYVPDSQETGSAASGFACCCSCTRGTKVDLSQPSSAEVDAALVRQANGDSARLEQLKKEFKQLKGVYGYAGACEMMQIE